MDVGQINASLKSGSAQFEGKDYKAAASSYEKALKLGGNVMKEKNLRMWAEVRMDLSYCYSELHRKVDAENLDRETLKALEGSSDFGPDHLLTADIRNQLVEDLFIQRDTSKGRNSRIAEQVALRQKNLDIWAKNKTDPQKMLETLHDQGFDLTSLGRSSEAEKIHKKVLQLVEKTSRKGKQDPKVLEARHNYAFVLFSQNKFEEAKKLFVENHKILSEIPEADRKGVQGLWKETEAFLEACNERTKDLAGSIALAQRSERWKSKPAKNHSTDRKAKSPDPPKIVVKESGQQGENVRAGKKSDVQDRPEQDGKGVKKIKSANEVLKAPPAKDEGKHRRSHSADADSSKIEKSGAAKPSLEDNKKKSQNLELPKEPVGKRPRSASETRDVGKTERHEASVESKRRLSADGVRPSANQVKIEHTAKDKATDRIKAEVKVDDKRKDPYPVQQNKDSAVLFEGWRIIVVHCRCLTEAGPQTGADAPSKERKHDPSKKPSSTRQVNLSEYYDARAHTPNAVL